MDEEALEELAMAWFERIGYETAFGPNIAPGGPDEERAEPQDVILWGRFKTALSQVNPKASARVLDDAIRTFKRRLADETNLAKRNAVFQEMLVEGIRVDERTASGTHTVAVRLVDREDPTNNNFLVVNQVEIIFDRNFRKPDVVLYLNGLPVGVFELKTFAREEVYLKNGFKQLQTYKKELPMLFETNQLLVVSNGKHARFGSLTAGWDRFMPWRSMDNDEPTTDMELRYMIESLFHPTMLVEYIHDFILFQQKAGQTIKIAAGYHQYHAAKAALQRTKEEVDKSGRGKIGVIWHTQGSGKSLTMTFLAGLIVKSASLNNPTILVVTDRNDLDGQLYATFDSAREYLRQEPVNIESKDDLIASLSGKQYGGIVFSTIQKFMPKDKDTRMEVLSDRTNIIIMADEAHRSQYDLLDGFAAHLNDAFPNASFIGFTGTPISFSDRDTRGIFGDDISIYDIKKSIEDKSTVKLYYDKQKRELTTKQSAQRIDEAFEAATEFEEQAVTEKAKRAGSRLQTIFGAESRLKDIVSHMEPHILARWESFPTGKSMIVCATRKICVDLHDLLKELHPEWYSERDDEGVMKVIMTGTAADSDAWGEHIRSGARRMDLGNRFKDPESDFRIAIVCDMWLTGFDAPSLSTMYIDKPLKGHGLMQALARVNRAFKDKTGGVIVDYFGLAGEIAKAVDHYTTTSGSAHKVMYDISDAEILLKEKHEVVKNQFHGIDHDNYWSLSALEKDDVRVAMLDRINGLVPRDTKASRRRFGQAMGLLNKAWNLAKASNAAHALRDDIKLYQALHGYINQKAPEEHRDPELLNSAIRQIVDDSITPEGLIDIVGLGQEQSIFDDAFIARVKKMEQKNLAQAAMEQLLRGKLKDLKRTNAVRERKFSEMLQATLDRYRDGDHEEMQSLIDDMLRLGKKLIEADKKGEGLGLSSEEFAFFEALELNEAAVREMGDDVLCDIARDIAVIVEEYKDDVAWLDGNRRQMAKFRVALKKVLKKYNYPPDKRNDAVETVLEQARLSAAA